MTGSDFLRRLVARLGLAEIPFMVPGSLASTYHGIPRSTHHIDVVVDLDDTSLRRLVAAFPEEEHYLSTDAARDALAKRRQFNIIDLGSGWKADLIVRKQRPFSRVEFERRGKAEVLGVSCTWRRRKTPSSASSSGRRWGSQSGNYGMHAASSTSRVALSTAATSANGPRRLVSRSCSPAATCRHEATKSRC